MKCYGVGLKLAAIIVAMFYTVSCTGTVDIVAQLLLTNCTPVQDFLGTTYEKLSESLLKPSAERIRVLVYGNSTAYKKGIPLKDSGNILWNKFPNFNINLPTEIVTHGFIQMYNGVHLKVLIDSLIKKGGRNVILLDTSQYTRFWYAYATTAARFIGEHLAKELAMLVTNGYDKSKIHLIGYSLGTVTVGATGKAFKSLTQQTLPWITGIEPTGPCFYNSGVEENLDKTDADFVDVIHTNMGVFGSAMQIGHADFYPNGGQYQPFLFLPLYSHASALYFYAESVLNVEAFPSVECWNYELFLVGGCSRNVRSNMGYGVSKTANGKYYLTTNGVSPHNKGNAGIPWFNSFARKSSLYDR